ncbi:NAD(P)-dependent oxidoreductase [Bernardetia sp. OM2101]|uniref:NAD(P)-dependent oxidoreductase n=1 Tax=Bernardetia sp. OM2101 TaxID=3344876 RepID=UPI0035CEE0FB
MKKRILIFGATGGTGKELVKQALASGNNVTSFARTPENLKVSHNNLRIIKGDVLNYGDVLKAMDNQDVVYCNLGMPASDKSTLRADGTTNIIKAMQEKGVKRFVCQTSLGFGDSKEVLPWYMKYIIVPFILKNAFKDHELQEVVIEKSNLDWTIVRPGNMTNGKLTEIYKHGFSPAEKIKLKVSRADVAHFMLSQIDNNKYLRKKVGISY